MYRRIQFKVGTFFLFILGPKRWHERYIAAKGDLQSPIDIETSCTREDSLLSALHLNYPSSFCDTTLTNDGRTMQITFNDKNASRKIKLFL